MGVKRKMGDLTDKTLDDMLKYQPFGGKRIEEWFKNIAAEDRNRIYTAIVSGMNEESLSIPSVMKNVFGDGGAVSATRKQVKMAARTLTIAVANQSKLEAYKEIMADGSGDITAIEWSSAFDKRTCPVCADMNGKRWDNSNIDEIKVPPLHPNCRCALLPYNDLVDEDEHGVGLAEDFHGLAKEEYEANTGKDWDALAESTREKKMYEYRRRWEKETGQSAYISLESSNFEDYLKTRSEQFQKEWLGTRPIKELGGKSRYDLWKEGKLKLDQMVNPDTGYRRTIDDLKKLFGAETSPEKTASKRREQEKQARLEEGETKDHIESAADVEKYLQYIETESQHKERLEADRLEGVLDGLKRSGRENGKEFRDAQSEIWRLRNKRAEQDRRAIHDYVTSTSGTMSEGLEKQVEECLGKKTKMNKKPLSESVQSSVKQGGTFVTKIIDSHNIEIDRPLPTIVTKEKRGSYDQKNNILDIGRQGFADHTTVHELGHFIEDNHDGIKQQCKAFFEKITEGQEIRSLKVDYPKSGYGDDEMYKPPKEGIKLPTPYATKINSDGTELLTVGLEELYRDPVGFSRDYPEYFDFIISTIRGAKK